MSTLKNVGIKMMNVLKPSRRAISKCIVDAYRVQLYKNSHKKGRLSWMITN